MRWAILLLRIPNNWMTELLQEHEVKIRLIGCKPYEYHGWNSLVRINSDEDMDPILHSIQKCREVLKTSFSRVSGHAVMGEVVMKRCQAGDALKQSECFMVSSNSKSDGWLEWSVAAESNSMIEDLFNLLEKHGCEVQLTRVSAYSSNSLTQRQDEILQFAVSNGYFEYPKRIKLRELALIFGVSLSTMSEILRAGERRVFSEYFGLY